MSLHRDSRIQAPAWISNPLPSRNVQLQTLQSTKEFDVLVVGGGATGCGVALDAVTRGRISHCIALHNGSNISFGVDAKVILNILFNIYL